VGRDRAPGAEAMNTEAMNTEAMNTDVGPNWPGCSTPPRAPLRAAIARPIIRRAVAGLPLRVQVPDRPWFGAGGATDPQVVVHRPAAFFARLAIDAKIGFGEAYMAGDWDTGPDTDLADLLTPLASNVATLVPPSLQRFRRLVERRQPADESGTPSQARQNIHRHYDLSNDLFTSFLDETLSYSSAMFEDGDDLATAQRRKVDAILDVAAVGPGCAMLEIGTGWGQLAIQAARRGAHVTTVTLSTEQRELALRRVAEAGVEDRVRIILADYREVTGEYDAIVSVEMIEAVGLHYFPDYFATLGRLLRPGGRVGLQSITIAHDRMLAARDSYTWITSTSSPADHSLRRGHRDHAADPRVVGDRQPTRFRPRLRDDVEVLAEQVSHELADDRRARVRSHLQADVGVLPGLLRSRVPRRLPRRQPVRPRKNVSWLLGATRGAVEGSLRLT